MAAAAASASALRRSLFRSRHFTAVAANPSPPGPISPDSLSRVKAAIRTESDPDRLADLFLSAAHLPAFRSDRPLYKLSVQKLARARRSDLVERLLDHHPLPPSEGFFARIISLYSQAGMPDHAAAAFARMPQIGCPPTELALAALLSALLHNGRIERLREAFDKLPAEHNIVPGVIHYNIFLQGFCFDGDVKSARKVLDEMASRGVTPDIVSYNAVLDVCLKKGDEVGFDEVLKEISTKGLKPNVTTFNHRITALCRKGKSSEAEELLDVMVMKGVLPNRASFNSIINGFCKEGEVGKALKVYERMQVTRRADGSEGVSRNFETYIVLLRSLVEKGEFIPALDICKECLTKKWAPPFDAVKGLIEGLKKNSQVKEAKDLVGKMRKAIKGDAVDAWRKVEDALAL